MMQKVLHVIPSLKYSSAARQLTLLTRGLPRDRFENHVVALGADGPGARELTQSGIAVECLGWKRAIDPRPLWKLRARIDALNPGLVHAWHPATVRALRLAGMARGTPARREPLLVSRPFGSRGRGFTEKLDGWLLKQADRIAVTGSVEAEKCRRLRLSESKLTRVRPGAADRATYHVAREEVLSRLPGVPPHARLIVCSGPLEPHKGLKNAVWAFGIVHYLYNDLHLVMIGSGPDAARLRQFADALGVPDRIHLVGEYADSTDLVSAAEVVWIPGRMGGMSAALEAMAAGRAVVAARRPEMAELLGQDQAGVLIPPDDAAALARTTRALLDDEALRCRLAENGKHRATHDFAAADMVRDYERVYDELIVAN